jgi:hypothetical protein
MDRQGQHPVTRQGNARFGLLKEGYFCISECVDGLFRITDDEYGSAVAGDPAVAESFNQGPLYSACVLKFVDQEVLYPVVKKEVEIGRIVFIEYEGPLAPGRRNLSGVSFCKEIHSALLHRRRRL